MREAVRLAERVATTDANVLVTGESGCGKDALSWFIHSRSQRAGESLVKIDCATLPADLLEAELFGYEDRKSTRLNSSHLVISYAVFCLKKKKIQPMRGLVFGYALVSDCISGRTPR